MHRQVHPLPCVIGLTLLDKAGVKGNFKGRMLVKERIRCFKRGKPGTLRFNID
jgi:hypothetical protein